MRPPLTTANQDDHAAAAAYLMKHAGASALMVLHAHTGQTILRAALTLVAFFWNQFAVLHREEDRDFLTQPELIAMRRRMAEGMDAMANAAVNKTEITVIDRESLVNPSLLADPRFGEFARNAVDRYQELELAVSNLSMLA